MKGAMQKIQRFGGAMFTPVLLFSFAGVMVGISTLCLTESIFGSLAAETSLWYRIWFMIQEGAWMVFRQMPLLFVIGLPIGLAKKQNARCVMEAFVTYITFNYFLAAVLKFWGAGLGVDYAAATGGTSGLTEICGIKTLDTGMLGALIISGIVVWIHNKYFDKELPEWLGIFAGSSFVVIIGFFVMIPTAFVFAGVWPKVQAGMRLLQEFFKASGALGVGMYAFCEKILLPTGLHHFIYSPFTLDSAVVPGGIAAYWPLHLQEFASSTLPLKEIFPVGFELFGNAKVFAPLGVTLAFYTTAKKERKEQVLALMIPAALTSMLTGITEPIEFTFLFIAPALFLVHALLCAGINMAMYVFGITGLFGNGLIEFISLNWIPCAQNHWKSYVLQIVIGLIFSMIWFLVFRFLILKFDFKTPGREDDAQETKLYTKQDYKNKKSGADLGYAAQILEFLGGKDNIIDVTNCATRLRVNVKDETLVKPEAAFKQIGAHGLSKNGTAIQVIVGLSVPKVREQFEECLAGNGPEPGAENAELAVAPEEPRTEMGAGCLYSPMTGKVIDLSEVPDDVFSQKVLGDGVAIIPSDGEVKSPVAGKVMVVSETKHAYALETDTGIEILIHIGLDTVKLNGKGFDALVKAGDYVDTGTVLCRIDKELYDNKEKPLYTPVLITNAAQLNHIETYPGNAEKGKTAIIKYE